MVIFIYFSVVPYTADKSLWISGPTPALTPGILQPYYIWFSLYLCLSLNSTGFSSFVRLRKLSGFSYKVTIFPFLMIM